jgi:uncharacterized protein (TIGR02270 family)
MSWNRPIFSPRVLRLHAENAAFLAGLVALSREGPATRQVDLYDFERRLSGHLDALRMAGPAGLQAAEDAMAETAGPGEVFVTFHLSLLMRPSARLDDHVPGIGMTPEMLAALAQAAAACPADRIGDRVRAWLTGADPVGAEVALRLCSARRADPRDLLRPFLRHRAPGVRVAALRLAGELGRADLLRDVMAVLRNTPEAEVGFWAAWAGVLLGERDDAPVALAGLAPTAPANRQRAAAELFPLVMPPARARAAIAERMRTDATRRWAVVAAGALGAADTIDWLIRQIDDPLLSRVAGMAFCQITGARLGPENLELAEFPDDPDDPVLAESPVEAFIDGHAYWPDPDRLRGWLAARRGRFAPDARHLLGVAAWTHQMPVDSLERGQLAYRALAHEFATRAPDARLPDWRAPVRATDRGFTRSW